MTERVIADWVVPGGKIGEIGHCTRCGEGLEIGGRQRFEVATAAMEDFVKIHSLCEEGDTRDDQAVSPQQWLKGRDVGISSCTIYAVMMNTPTPMSTYDVPHDPSDFGRCYRLLELFPQWKMRMDEVGERFPKWIPFLASWGQLTVMYEHAIRTKAKAVPEMYELMKRLECQGADLDNTQASS